MARIIPAFMQFFDDNGDPLINGYLHFFQSGSTTDKATFADKNYTIANTNPVQLDGAGRCPNIFGSGEYNIISYTSDMIQIQQFDPVYGTIANLPDYFPGIVLSNKTEAADLDITEGNAGQLIFITSDDGGEFLIEYNPTPATYADDGGSYCGTQFIPTGGDGTIGFVRQYSGAINVLWFGAVGDGSTDDTTAIQNAINVAATNRAYSVFLPSGIYAVTTLYGHYDASLNPGYPSGTYRSGRLSISGERRMDFATSAFTSDFVGSVIKTTSTTGSAIYFGDGSVNDVGIELKNLSVVGTTTGNLVYLNKAPQFSNLENLLIHNKGAGKGLVIANGFWTSSVRNVYVSCHNGTSTPTAGTVAIECGTAGLSHFDNITVSYADIGVKFGTSSENFGYANVITAFQATHCNDGVQVFGGTALTINGMWIEQGGGDFDLKVYGSSEAVTINGLLTTSTSLSLASVILGDNTGTPTTDSCKNIIFNTSAFNFVTNYGLIKYADCIDITLNNPLFKNNGGIAIAIDDSGTVSSTRIISPNWYPTGASAEMPKGKRVRKLSGGASDQTYLATFIKDSQDETSTLTGIAGTAITNCADNGSGLIRVTSTAHGLATGDYSHIENVTGTTEANGEWVVTVIDANTFDLDGSTFTNPYVSGGNAYKYVLDLTNFTFVPTAFKTVTTTGRVYVRLPANGDAGEIMSVYKNYAAQQIGLSAPNIDGATLLSATTVDSVLTVRKITNDLWTQL